MTIEEKAKRYNEALERARECMKDGGISQNTIDYLCNIFPELKESEHLRIKQSIIADIKSKMNNCTHTLDGYYREQIAWLEKQGKKGGDE